MFEKTGLDAVANVSPNLRDSIVRRMGFGDNLVVMNAESTKRITEIMSWDIIGFWGKTWSNWKRDGAPLYTKAIGEVDAQEVWLISEPIWTVFTAGLSREEAIQRMCDPEDLLKFSMCPFGSANWTEFVELFGRAVFSGTDQEAELEGWYESGWASFLRTVDALTEGYRRCAMPQSV